MWGQCHQSGLPDLREAAAAWGGPGGAASWGVRPFWVSWCWRNRDGEQQWCGGAWRWECPWVSREQGVDPVQLVQKTHMKEAGI